MRTHAKRNTRPAVESIEDRCLLSVATVEVSNASSYTETFNFRWSPSASWTKYTEAPNTYEVFWNNYSTSYQPQVEYDTTTSSSSQTTVNLSQGYDQWFGTGTPPTSACKLYQFQNTSAGATLYYVPPTNEDAVVDITNNSTYNITFQFRWSPSSSWSSYTVTPGHYELLWNTYSNSYAPQVQYYTTTSGNSQTVVNLSQGYDQWFGSGTPPTSAATPYEFLNTTSGVLLYYNTPTSASGATTSPNWAGYYAATSLTSPQANSVSAVYGSWIVPKVSGPSTGSEDSSVWVGIDGFGNNTVEQIGTEEGVTNGVPYYDVWWEMYSTGDKQPEQIISGMTVTPGDSITASVVYTSSGFYLSIADNTRNEFFNITKTSASTQSPLATRSMAEWVIESPGKPGGGLYPLANFGTVEFTNASAVINGVSGPINSSSWKSQAINLFGNNVQGDTTSVLGNNGSSFSVAWNSSSGGVMVPSSAAATQSGTALISVVPTGKKAAASALSVPAGPLGWGVVPFRTPIRQLKGSTSTFSFGKLFSE